MQKARGKNESKMGQNDDKGNKKLSLRKQIRAELESLITDSEMTQQRPYTCVVLTLRGKNGSQRIKAIGFSKVCYPDDWRPEYGYELAKEKALAHLAKAIARGDQTFAWC